MMTDPMSTNQSETEKPYTIDEKRLYEVKGRIAGIVQSAALFGADAGRGHYASFNGGDIADLIDELIVIRIKQALNTSLTSPHTSVREKE